MDFQNYIMPELLVLVPVLYLIGMGIKRTEKFSDKHIPLILGAVGVILCALYIFAHEPANGSQEVATALFSAITQGVLVAGASVYINQIIKQETKGE